MNISAVLLAGGESRRMGQDKAILLFQGKPLWESQLELLCKLRPREVFLSARTDPAWRPADVSFVRDEPPSRGPLSGLAATLSRIRTDHLLALGIDMPLMSEGFLRSLCQRVEPCSGVVPIIADRIEPLAAIYPKAARTDFIGALAGRDYSLQSLAKSLIAIGKLHLVNVSQEEEKLFQNLNRPADFG